MIRTKNKTRVKCSLNKFRGKRERDENNKNTMFGHIFKGENSRVFQEKWYEMKDWSLIYLPWALNLSQVVLELDTEAITKPSQRCCWRINNTSLLNDVYQGRRLHL